MHVSARLGGSKGVGQGGLKGWGRMFEIAPPRFPLGKSTQWKQVLSNDVIHTFSL